MQTLKFIRKDSGRGLSSYVDVWMAIPRKLTEILENDGSTDKDWFLSMDDVSLQC